MHMSLAQWVVPVVIAALEATILVVLFRRGLRRSLPFFFGYLAFNIFGSLLLAVAVNGSPMQYFYAFWSVTAISMFFGFAVLYEVFLGALKPFSAVIDLAKVLFGWAAFFLLATALLTAVATSGPHTNKICAGVELMSRSVQLMQCGLLLLLVVFQTRFGLSWRNHGMAIALGVGVSSAIGLIASYVQSHLPAWEATVDLFDGWLRIGVLAFWVVVLMLPEPSTKTAQDSPKHLILQRWNEALVSYRNGQTTVTAGSMDSFLPGIERTVDRVLARKAMH